MRCPHCHAEYTDDDLECPECGRVVPTPTSRSLVATTQSNLPAVFKNPQIPRLAAGVGAVAVGVGFELLRRGLLTRLARPGRIGLPEQLPTFSGLKDALTPQSRKITKLPKGYEVQETIYYVRRVMRRQD